MLRAVSVFGPDVTIPSSAAAADWLPDRLGTFGTVVGLVPGGYDAYLFVDHATAAVSRSTTAPPEVVAGLASSLTGHTLTPARGWFGIWTGYGWTSSRTLVSTRATRRERRRLKQADESQAETLGSELDLIPRFEFPGREYYLLSGRALAGARIESPDGHGLQPPDLWWPDDRAWFVATDTDLSWTYVAGSRALAQDIARAFPGRAMPVTPSMTNTTVGDMAAARR